MNAGDVVAGKYRIERVIGRGGMGMVVAAMHLQLEKRVALKFLLPEVGSNPELVARFSREARAASRIQSEHVTKVLDVGTFENGAPFMVMEYLEGTDLAQLIRARGALGGHDAIEYVLQACEALAEAHVAGIVHRDLKPANLFLTTRADGAPCIKILDFGISKVALGDDQGPGMTQTSAMMGSPNYMAPEQLRSARNVDARTDIWALGIILQELLTGEVAFRADTVPELYVCILQSPPIPLRARRPDAPPALEAIVLRCLEKDPARRFANVAELAAALGDFAPPRARASVESIARVLAARGVGSGASQPPIAPPAQPGAHARSVPPQPVAQPMPPAAHSSYAPQQPGAYGPALGYGYAGQPPQQPRPPHPQPPFAMGPPPRPPDQGLSPAVIALLIILAFLVLGGGGCMTCFCIGAANQPRHAEASEVLGPRLGGRRLSESRLGESRLNESRLSESGGRRASALSASRASGVPFQRPAGWTTVFVGATSRPSLGPRLRRGPTSDVAQRARAWVCDSSGRSRWGRKRPQTPRGHRQRNSSAPRRRSRRAQFTLEPHAAPVQPPSRSRS